MGRRRSIFGMVLREMESAAKRSAADHRRLGRRIEGVRARALEREFVRQEREGERSRKRAERDAERAAIGDEKAAQRADWKAEVDEAHQRDEDLLRIGNESPEVEDRDGLYKELLEVRPYSAPEFVAPALPREVGQALTVKHFKVVDLKVLEAEPRLRGFAVVQALLCVGVLVGAAASFAFPASNAALATAAGVIAIVLTEGARRAARSRQLDSLRQKLTTDAKRVVAGEQAEALTRHQAQAREEWDSRVKLEQGSYERDESTRMTEVRALLEGDLPAMRAYLEEVLPLELPIACPAKSHVTSREEVSLHLTAPPRSAIPPKEGHLLASGKPSWKDKTAKRMAAEYQTLVAGLALRHASEAMLVLPTVQMVKVTCSGQDTDVATGRTATADLLTVQFDYVTLAPLQMDGIDPVAALQHFGHEGTLVKKLSGKRAKGED